MSMSEVKTLLVLFFILVLPGWAFLGVTNEWKKWNGLQRWCVAVGISIVFYPVLFYWARDILPDVHLGVRKLQLLLVIFAGLILWRFWKNWRVVFEFSQSEWIAVGIFIATVFSRLWMAHLYPYPAWSDSLHHTLLTQLTAANGQFPRSLAPYEPIPLNMYHLGLYAITGVVQILASVQSTMALVWTSQLLSGLCGVGVYLVLDRKVGRTAALVGSVVVGLLSFQPAWYFNWGRFTQLSSQSVLLIAWMVSWEALANWRQPGPRRIKNLLSITAASMLLSAGVFLLHYRVAGFYLPLLAITVIWEFYQAYRCKTFKRMWVGTVLIGAFSILLTAPALGNALSTFIQARLQTMAAGTKFNENPYFQFGFDAHFAIGFQKWLFVWAIVCAGIGIVRKNFIILLGLVWIAFLWLVGNAFMFNIPLISFTNYGAVIIGYYMPMALIIGAGMDEFLHMLPGKRQLFFQQVGLVGLLLAGFVGSHMREKGVEPYRYFMTASDEVAMTWINQNTAPDAVFAINTYRWNSSFHGMDGGYWIPFYTNRKTTTGSMLYPLAFPDYRSWISERSESVKRLETDPSAVESLCQLDVKYVYLGASTLFQGTRLTPEIMSTVPGAALLYNQQNVWIYQICGL